MTPGAPVPELHACRAATALAVDPPEGPRALSAPRPGTPVARPPGVRRTLVALVTLLCHGCATVQVRTDVPASGPPGRVLLAEPELWLWMEGSGPADPAESSAALEASQAALARALQGRGFAVEGEPDQILVVRAAAVARTEERRRAQVAATVAAVVFFVAVVAIIVVVATKGGSSRGHGPAVAAAPPHGIPHAVRPPLRAPMLGPPVWWWGFDLHVQVPLAPQAAPAVPEASPFAAGLAQRGFFEGDAVELTVELQDFRTGEVRLSRTVRGQVDPRDAEAVRALVDRAIGDQPWGRSQPGPSGTPVSL